jgi:hypothetical protein
VPLNNVQFRVKYGDIIKRRDGQLFLVLQRKWAKWLFPGATIDLSVEDGELLVRGLTKPDRPKQRAKRTK